MSCDLISSKLTIADLNQIISADFHNNQVVNSKTLYFATFSKLQKVMPTCWQNVKVKKSLNL